MNRTLLILAGALVIGGLFVVYLYRDAFITHETGGAPVEVLTAFIDIPIGTPVRDDWITTHEIPASYVEQRHLTVDYRNDIVGLPLAQAVMAGESILRTDLSPLADARNTLSSAVPAGMRAITLPTNRTSVQGGLLQPGDRVDVLLNVVQFGDASAGRVVVLLENVLVLAYGQEILREASASGEASSTSTRISTNVTLQVTVDEGALLTQARGPGGIIMLVLRNPNDTAVSTTRVPDVRWVDVMELPRRARFLRVAVRSLIPVFADPTDPAVDPTGSGATGALVPGAFPPGVTLPPGVLPPGAASIAAGALGGGSLGAASDVPAYAAPVPGAPAPLGP